MVEVGAVAGAATAMGQLGWVGARSNSSSSFSCFSSCSCTQFLKFTPSLVVVRPFYFSEGSSKGQLLIYCLDPTKVHL